QQAPIRGATGVSGPRLLRPALTTPTRTPGRAGVLPRSRVVRPSGGRPREGPPRDDLGRVPPRDPRAPTSAAPGGWAAEQLFQSVVVRREVLLQPRPHRRIEVAGPRVVPRERRWQPLWQPEELQDGGVRAHRRGEEVLAVHHVHALAREHAEQPGQLL